MTEVWHPGMKQMPPPEPEVDPVALQQALNQNVKQKLIPNQLDPLGALIKVIQAKAPSNQIEAELMAGILEQQLNNRR